MIKQSLFLGILSVVAINIGAMDIHPTQDAQPVQFFRATINIRGEKQIDKAGYIKLPQAYTSESEIPKEFIATLDDELKKAVLACKDLMDNNSRLKSLMQANSSFLFMSSSLVAVKEEASDKQTIEPIIAELLVMQNLCEHGGTCKICKDAAGWSFMKNMSVQIYEQASKSAFCSPLELQYHNEEKQLHGKVKFVSFAECSNNLKIKLMISSLLSLPFSI